jgi:hypothetical protein
VLDRPVPITCAIDRRYTAGCRENIQTAFQDSLQAIGVIGAILGGIEVILRLCLGQLGYVFDGRVFMLNDHFLYIFNTYVYILFHEQSNQSI